MTNNPIESQDESDRMDAQGELQEALANLNAAILRGNRDALRGICNRINEGVEVSQFAVDIREEVADRLDNLYDRACAVREKYNPTFLQFDLSVIESIVDYAAGE